MEGSVRSISIAFAILRQLARNGDELTLSEISRLVGISPSSCLAILRTLVNEGALDVLPRKRYAISESWAAVEGLVTSSEERLLDWAKPFLQRVAQAQDVTVGLWRIMPNERVELVRLGESNSAMRIHMAVGQRQPIGAGSIGRAIASAQNVGNDEVRRRFEALRWERPITFEEYREQIAMAVERGYAVDDGWTFAGVSSIAVIVPAEPISLCISASSFAGSRNNSAMDLIGSALVMLADRIASEAPLT